VFLKHTAVIGDISDADKLVLDGAVDPDPAALLAYPYDGMVYPTGLPAPELMWNGSGAGDKYLIHYQHELLDVKIYTTAEPPSRFLIEQPLWDAMAKTVAGGQLNLRVHRLVLGQPTATVVTDDLWTISAEPLIGSVYYWANSLGRVLRINPGATAPEDFLAAGGQNGCSTCHSVSANGRTLILGGDISVSNWDLVSNTSKLDLTSVGKPVRNWAMAGISADGAVVVENGELNLPGPPGGGDAMWDALTGAKLANTGLDGVTLNMPAFSANNKKLAYVDHTTLALGVRDYDAALKAVSNPLELVLPGNDPNLNGITFPSVMPDGSWITYHRGAYPNSLDTRLSPGYLYLASSSQPGVEIRLANANGDTYPVRRRRPRPRLGLRADLRAAQLRRLRVGGVHVAAHLRQPQPGQQGRGQAAVDDGDRREPAAGRRPVALAVLDAGAGREHAEHARLLGAREGRPRRLTRAAPQQGQPWYGISKCCTGVGVARLSIVMPLLVTASSQPSRSRSMIASGPTKPGWSSKVRLSPSRLKSSATWSENRLLHGSPPSPTTTLRKLRVPPISSQRVMCRLSRR
jgi:hypothetical protein